jgi:hypothetical protein
MFKNKGSIIPFMEKISSLLMYAVVAVEVIEFAKTKYNQLQNEGSKSDKEGVEDVQ